MVKAQYASKGNLGDAVVAKWPATIAKVKKPSPYPICHTGAWTPRGVELLDYTIELFSDNAGK
ncbi:MAG: hypothetical protein R2795_24140 [Saprospiraceae bacterium]